MKLKLYIGQEETIQQEDGGIITIVNSPSTGGTDSISFDYYPNWPLTNTTSTVTVPLIAVPFPYSNEQMAADFRAFITILYNNLTANYSSGDTFVTVSMNNGSPIFNYVFSDIFGFGEPKLVDVLTTNYVPIELFKDETMELTSKLNDIEKLSNIFSDFTNSFTVPANDINNTLFKHYYDIDNDNTFNAALRTLAYIEIDSLPLRYGKLQLESITLKNQRPDSYKITFYGRLIQLTDLFSDDLISQLDYKEDVFGNLTKTWDSLSQYDFPFNESSFIKLLTEPSFNEGLIMPLINYGSHEWNYGTGVNNAVSYDISTVGGAINSRTLRPALRVLAIIKAIEIKYGIEFSRTFFNEAHFQNYFMWLNGDSEKQRFQLDFTSQFALVPGNFPDPRGYLTTVDVNTNIIKLETFDVSSNPRGKSDDIIFNLYWPYAGVGNNLDAVDGTDVTMTVSYIDRRPATYGQVFFTQTKTFSPSDAPFFQNIISASALGITVGNPLFFDIFIETNKAVVWNNFRFNVLYSYLPPFDVFLYEDRSDNSTGLSNDYIVSAIMPNIKVIDWLQGIMKQFKLIIRPITQTTFEIMPIDDFYANGTFIDITDYVDQTEVVYERPLIYKDIKFKYEKTSNVLGKKFREINDPVNDEIGYGDLRAFYANLETKEVLEVKVPFENMLFERLINDATSYTSNIYIGESITVSDTGSISPNKSKPIFFYNNGITDFDGLTVRVQFKSYAATSGITRSHLIGNTDDAILSQVNNTINFGSENDPWHMSRVDNSLYLNYWSNWVDTIYDIKQRKISYKSNNLPSRYIQELSLNDRLIIGNQRYKINDYTINLTDGSTNFTLFKDIYDWNGYSFQNQIINQNRSFTPNGWYYTDYASNDTSAFIYGSFSGYNGNSYGKIIKLNVDGSEDTSFSAGTGFNTNTYSFQSMLLQEDGKLMFAGDFTTYNGASFGRIVRLNSDGSVDTSFNSGTGFNNLTSAVKIDSQGKYYVGGSYSSYSGVSANRIIKLNSDGTVDSGFSYGTGFNNVTNDILVNGDDSIFVSGYFTSYNGTAKSHLVKLTSGGTIDTSFADGGFTIGSSEPIGMVQSNGLICYGYFTAYSGVSTNRIVKLNDNGTINQLFLANMGTGFNNVIYYANIILGDKILLQGNFTSYDGISSLGVIILNNDGTIYRTFETPYLNVYAIGNKVYGNVNNGPQLLIFNNDLPVIPTSNIVMNAGEKFFGINIITQDAWIVSDLIDYGFGTDWVEFDSLSGTGSTELVFKVNDKTTQTAPSVNNPRNMSFLIKIGNMKYGVTVTQNGLS